MLDIFNNDAFSVQSLTAGIIALPHKPGLIGSLGLFQEEGVTTTTVSIEVTKDGFTLIPAKPRGAPGTPRGGNGRSLVPFSTAHLPQTASVMADSIQNVRAFGSENQLEGIQQVINQRLTRMRNDIDVTLEYHRIGAIKGQVLDADGSVLIDLFTRFGVTQNTKAITFGNDTAKILPQLTDAIRLSEDELGGAPVTGYVVLTGKGFWNTMIGNKEIRETYLNWASNETMRQDNRMGFRWGDVNWREYRGKVGPTSFVGDNDAYLVPLGVPDLFITRFAPADYMETVNTVGLPYYAKQEPMKFGKGIELESQSNPLSLCTRPKAVIKLTLS